MSPDILQQHVSGSYHANDTEDVRPEVSLIAAAFPLPGVAEWLAGVASGEPVHGLEVVQVEGSEVAVVRDARETVGKNRGRVPVVLDVPGVLQWLTERKLQAQVESAVATAQAADSHAAPSLALDASRAALYASLAALQPSGVLPGPSAYSGAYGGGWGVFPRRSVYDHGSCSLTSPTDL